MGGGVSYWLTSPVSGCVHVGCFPRNRGDFPFALPFFCVTKKPRASFIAKTRARM